MNSGDLPCTPQVLLDRLTDEISSLNMSAALAREVLDDQIAPELAATVIRMARSGVRCVQLLEMLRSSLDRG